MCAVNARERCLREKRLGLADSRVVHVASQVLGAHDVVRPAVGLAGDDRQLRDRSLGVREEQLR